MGRKCHTGISGSFRIVLARILLTDEIVLARPLITNFKCANVPE